MGGGEVGGGIGVVFEYGGFGEVIGDGEVGDGEG